jgi:REP element-mobilizing transposase RayT
MTVDYPERKSTRLRGFDYRNTDAYFVTICTHERARVLSAICDGRVELTQLGAIAEWCWFDLPQHYGFVELDAFVVMPDHVHAIIGLGAGRPHKGAKRRPPVSEVVRAFKTESARRINNVRGLRGAPVWQRSFYDHIIRDDADLERVREYIAGNPSAWIEDAHDPIPISIHHPMLPA